MNEHPTHEELEAFLNADLLADETSDVLAHLLRGCPRCQAEVAARSASILEEPEPEPELVELSDDLDAAYDLALDRAFASAVSRAQEEHAWYEEALTALVEEGPAALLGQTPRLGGNAVCEALLQRCQALRHEDPAQMVYLAQLATDVAWSLRDAGIGDPADVADLEARAWGELGNAYRVAEQLQPSEQALARAFEHYEEGSGDPLLAARLFDLQASLFVAQRRFEAALGLLDTVHAIHHQHGDLYSAGRALISKGLYTGYSGNPSEAIRLLNEGLALTGGGQDPNLALSAVHNLIFFMVQCGRFEEAHVLLRQNRWRYERDGARLNLIKHAWLGGLIQAGLGRLGRAERDLLKAQKGFEEAGLAFQSAITSLDLATVLLRQGRSADARELVEDSIEVFTALRIGREALGAVVLLQKAFALERATTDLVQSVAEFLRRFEQNPSARYEMGPI